VFHWISGVPRSDVAQAIPQKRSKAGCGAEYDGLEYNSKLETT